MSNVLFKRDNVAIRCIARNADDYSKLISFRLPMQNAANTAGSIILNCMLSLRFFLLILYIRDSGIAHFFIRFNGNDVQ
jgi:hypothetical protein